MKRDLKYIKKLGRKETNKEWLQRKAYESVINQPWGRDRRFKMALVDMTVEDGVVEDRVYYEIYHDQKEVLMDLWKEKFSKTYDTTVTHAIIDQKADSEIKNIEILSHCVGAYEE